MKKSDKKIKEKMNRILYEHFENSHDNMKEFVFKMAGYALNHPDYLKKMDDPLFAWLDMDSTVFIADYLYLAYELTKPEHKNTSSEVPGFQSV